MSLPAGDVTVLFTDIEGSTQLWEQWSGEMARVVGRHRAILEDAICHAGGRVVKDTGDGIFAVFSASAAGVAAAVDAQRRLEAETWPLPSPLRVRMGLHRGTIEPDGADYHGPLINRAARIMGAAWGGQIVVSEAVRVAVDDTVVTEDLGLHRLKDLADPVRLHQVRADGMPSRFPPLRTLEGTPNNLPASTEPLIGREGEVATLLAILAGARAVTLTGAGGSGKTRLAIQVAAEALGDFPAGAWFVDLASLASGAVVPDAVRSAMRFPPRPGIEWTDELATHCCGRPSLLVLDNCEHLVDDVARFVDLALRSVPEVKVLATSREPLRVPGEVIHAVPPLALPDEGSAITASPAVQLFLERASAAGAGAVNENELAHVAAICHRLDGIPLAIELAAARARTLPVADIEARLDDRFRLLTGGARTAVPRQRTLEATVAWSYEPLDHRSKEAFAALTVFAGRFRSEDATAVLAALGLDGIEALDALTALCERSLLVSSSGRFSMLETIRAYGRGRMAVMESATAVRDAHAAWVQQLAGEAFTHLDRTGLHAATSRRVSDTIDDIRAAITYLRDTNRVGDALLTASFLYRYWASQRLHEGQSLLGELLDEAEATGVGPDVVQVGLTTLAGLVDISGHFEQAAALSERALKISQAGEGLLPIHIVRYVRGRSLADLGDWNGFRRNYEIMIEEALEADDRPIAGMGMMYLASYAVRHGDLHAAAELVAREAELLGQDAPAASLGHVAEQRTTLHVLNGRLEEARASAIESLERFGELGHRVCIAHALESAAMVLLEHGRVDDAATVYEAAAEIRREIGAPPFWFECLLYDRVRTALQAALTQEDWSRARDRVAALEDDAAAVRQALAALR